VPRVAIVLSIVVGLALAAAGCAGGSPGASGGSPGASAGSPGASAGSPGASQVAASKIRLQLAYHATSQAVWPMWIAKEIGAFDKYGIDAELVFVEGNRAVNGVIAGTTPIAFVAGNDVMAPAAQGADLVALMTSGGEQPGNQIWGAKGIASAADLRGKIAGANELGGETDKLLRYGLQQMGLTPGKDIQIVSVGEQSVRVAALQTNRVQAAIMDPGFEQKLQEMGFTQLFDFRKSSLLLQKGTVVTTRKYLDQNRDVVTNVMKALLEGVAYEKSNKEGTIKIAQKYAAQVGADVVSTLWDRYAPALPKVPVVQPSAFEGLKIFSEDPKVKALDTSKLVDSSIVESLDSSGFINSLYAQ